MNCMMCAKTLDSVYPIDVPEDMVEKVGQQIIVLCKDCYDLAGDYYLMTFCLGCNNRFLLHRNVMLELFKEFEESYDKIINGRYYLATIPFCGGCIDG